MHAEIIISMCSIIICLLLCQRIARYQYGKKGIFAIFVLYFFILTGVTLFTRVPAENATLIYIPFQAAKKAFQFDGFIILALLYGKIILVNAEALAGIILNILLFIPLGYLFPVLVPKCRTWPKMILLGFVTSLTIETIQLFTHLGWFDVDDLIHNTIGAMLGYLAYKKILISRT